MAPHHDVDDSEVFLQPVAYEAYSLLQQVEQLEVDGLQSGEVLGAHAGVQVPRLDAGELCQVVHNLGRVCVCVCVWRGGETRRRHVHTLEAIS